MSMVDSFEKIPVRIFSNLKEGSVFIAQEIAKTIRQKQAEGKPAVLGLATGSSPKAVYAELVRLHREEGLSFSNVISFNLDEYYPIDKDALQSYNRYMKEQLFNHVDIKPENIHIPSGEWPKDEIKKYTEAYDQKIRDLGGIEIQILGIG